MSELLDRADRISGGMALRYDRRNPGGEHDYIRHLPRRTRNILRGAGRLSATRGEHPDVFADCLRDYMPAWAELTDCQVIGQWVELVLAGLVERRAEVRRARRRRLAATIHAESEYHYRTIKALLAGFASLWHYRKARGWT